WPPASRHTSTRSSIASCPAITRLISNSASSSFVSSSRSTAPACSSAMQASLHVSLAGLPWAPLKVAGLPPRVGAPKGVLGGFHECPCCVVLGADGRRLRQREAGLDRGGG